MAKVTILAPGAAHAGVQMNRVPSDRASSGGWQPRAVLGAASAFGLMLPEAKPSAAHVYAPRGVHLDADRVIVSDTGNHRVMIYNGHPDTDEPDCDVVLGQPDAFTEGPQGGGRGPESGMHLPTGVLVTDDGRLVVADAWNHRILVWNDVPDHDRPADLVLGQPDASSVEPNGSASKGGGDATASVFYWPFGMALIDGRFYVADTGNRRVLCWADGVPQSPDVPASVVLGQADAQSRDENAGDVAGPNSFRWSHAICGDGNGGVLVADAGNHRVLSWSLPPLTSQDADGVLGQPDMITASEFPYAPQKGTRFRFPYGICASEGNLAIADTSNNRVLIWDGMPEHQDVDPVAVIGQDTFSGNGENRWQSVGRDTLCWPYGLAAWGPLLAVADSGNNRVVLWENVSP
jgi:hypothetical protein